jgi:hypothetical protein
MGSACNIYVRKGTLPLCVVLVISDNSYELMFSSIGNSRIICVEFKCGCHEDKDIPWVLASRSSIPREKYYMIKILEVQF